MIERNIIVHGVREDGNECKGNQFTKDEVFLGTLFEALEETGRKPTFVGRIGKKQAEKSRSLKVASSNENDKKTQSERSSKCGLTKQKQEATKQMG